MSTRKVLLSSAISRVTLAMRAGGLLLFTLGAVVSGFLWGVDAAFGVGALGVLLMECAPRVDIVTREDQLS